MSRKLTRARKKELGLLELIAIALGGMVGGGIFSILGISVSHIGNTTPVAIIIGGVLATFAAYSYVKLAGLYKDEGATYSFFKKTFPNSKFASSIIGWLIVFGYISTLALYAFTFSSYFCSVLSIGSSTWMNKLVAGGIILAFAVINVASVKGMGKLEDWMVYTKVLLLLFISGLLAGKGDVKNFTPIFTHDSSIIKIIVIASVTFVAYEGFQLVIHAYNEMEKPEKNIPRAIYSAVVIATLLYTILALGALATIPKEAIIQDQEYALAAGSKKILGNFGYFVVIFGALLATSSAISGTIFGASRLMAVIANDGCFPRFLSKRIKTHIPANAIIAMSVLSFILILSGGLETLLEFGSITFIVVSLLMSFANYKKRKETKANIYISIIAMIGLFVAIVSIFYFEVTEALDKLYYTLGTYVILVVGALVYSKREARLKRRSL